MTLPLAGRGVLLTRPEGQNQEAWSLLAGLGARPVELPLIRIVPPENYAEIDAVVAGIGDFDLVVFTSANAVRGLMERARELSLGPSSTRWPPAAAVGPKTAAAAADAGLRIETLPEGNFQGSGLAEMLAPKAAGRRILFPRAAKVGETLPDALRDAGAELVEVVVYRTVPAKLPEGALAGVLKSERIEAILLGSPSAARALVDGLGGPAGAGEALHGIALAAIGPVTGRMLLEAGLCPTVVTERFTMTDLVAALDSHFAAITND